MQIRGFFVTLIILFFIFGIVLHTPLVISEEGPTSSDSSNSGTNSLTTVTDNSNSSSTSRDGKNSDSASVISTNSTNDKEEVEDKNETEKVVNDIRRDFRERVKEGSVEISTAANCTIKVEKTIRIENGKRVEVIKRKIICGDGVEREIKIKVENRTVNGNVREKINYEADGEELEVGAGEGIKIEEESNATDYRLKARIRNGNVTNIKIMPDTASEIALERLRALNFTVELKEIKHKNVPKVVYNIETNKHGRFLGIFKLSMKVEGQIDPETGEFLGVSKPWWAFLVAGEDSPDKSLIEGKTRIKAESFNGTSEVIIELRFGTKEIEKEKITNEILNRLSNLNVSSLPEIKESDGPIEDKEKLEVKAKIKDDLTDVKFRFKFVVNSDNREDIINALRTKLSGITAEEINNVFSLEAKGKSENLKTINLLEQNNSNQSGIAKLVEENGKVIVTISLAEFTEGISQPVHIHSGKCPDVGAVVYPLTNVLNGKSVTVLNVTLSELEKGLPLAINVHKSIDEAKVYTACGDLDF